MNKIDLAILLAVVIALFLTVGIVVLVKSLIPFMMLGVILVALAVWTRNRHP